MFYMLKKKNIYPAYVSKHNSNRKNQAILLMISNGENGIIYSQQTIDIVKRNYIKK